MVENPGTEIISRVNDLRRPPRVCWHTTAYRNTILQGRTQDFRRGGAERGGGGGGAEIRHRP